MSIIIIPLLHYHCHHSLLLHLITTAVAALPPLTITIMLAQTIYLDHLHLLLPLRLIYFVVLFRYLVHTLSMASLTSVWSVILVAFLCLDLVQYCPSDYVWCYVCWSCGATYVFIFVLLLYYCHCPHLYHSHHYSFYESEGDVWRLLSVLTFFCCCCHCHCYCYCYYYCYSR